MEHLLASKITEWCAGRNDMSETQAAVVTYGIELLFNTLFKLIGLLILAGLFHRTLEVIVAIVCFSLLRSQAGGVHMQTSIGCFSAMVFIAALSCLGAEFITHLPPALLAGISVGIVVLNKLYAPFFTENNPIEDEKIIKRKNIGAVVLSVLMLAVIWMVRFGR